MGLYVVFPWISMEFPKKYNAVPWDSHRAPIGLCFSHGSPVGSRWVSHGTFMGIPMVYTVVDLSILMWISHVVPIQS